jgi:hypothetical protein
MDRLSLDVEELWLETVLVTQTSAMIQKTIRIFEDFWEGQSEFTLDETWIDPSPHKLRRVSSQSEYSYSWYETLNMSIKKIIISGQTLKIIQQLFLYQWSYFQDGLNFLKAFNRENIEKVTFDNAQWEIRWTKIQKVILPNFDFKFLIQQSIL